MSWNFLKPTIKSFTLSFVSLLGPIFIPKRPVGGLDNILDLTLSAPELLNPNLFINASSSSSLKTLGLGLPYCLSGVIVPTST